MELGRKLRRHIEIAPSGCWEWIGGRATGGYGKLTHEGKCTVAHRWSYQYFVGPIPEGMQLDHLCRNRGCVNPQHLEPVTPRTNLLRGEGTWASVNAAKTHCPQGHEYTEGNTYRHADGRRVCIACRRIRDMRDGPRERRKLYKRAQRSAAKHADQEGTL